MSNDPNTTWAGWAQMMAGMPRLGMDAPGWAKCRIGNRDGREGEKVNWVFGIAKGDFGIWVAEYPICYHPQGDFEFTETPPTRALAAMTHIGTGLGLGLFNEVTLAIEAADIIQSAIDWRAAPTTDESAANANYWALTLTKVHRSWEFCGIDHHPHMHCHAYPGGPEHGIWAKWEGGHNQPKPERLS